MAGEDEQKEVGKSYTLDDVKNHNAEKDTWFVVHGKVYDVSQYAKKHPGGVEIMNENAGKDVSDQFEEFFHSQDARTTLKTMEIGVLEGSTEEDWKKLDEAGSGDSGDGSGSLTYLLPLLIVILAVFYQLNTQMKWF
mmetsp:Transcript_1164/g.1626  ORF Transcript_1164/g.1626 Transcript_1164/m.1626 type:complete len:137 (+) Transcript_1164:77-487(+)